MVLRLEQDLQLICMSYWRDRGPARIHLVTLRLALILESRTYDPEQERPPSTGYAITRGADANQPRRLG